MSQNKTTKGDARHVRWYGRSWRGIKRGYTWPVKLYSRRLERRRAKAETKNRAAE